jgi:hypothetical protein
LCASHPEIKARAQGKTCQRGRKSAGATGTDGTPPPGAGEDWVCPVSKCQDLTAHPLDECEEFKDLSVTQRQKAVKEWDRCEMLPHGLPRQGDGREVLPPDRVSAAPPSEAGGSGRNGSRQGLRMSATATSKDGGRRSGSGPQGRSPQETQSGQRRTRLRPRLGDPAAEADSYVVLPCSGQEQRIGLAQSHQKSARGRDEDHASGSDTIGASAERHRGVPSEAEAVW